MSTFVSSVRKAAVAGRFYPAEATQLERVVRNYVGRHTSALKGVRGIIVPHAGYACSGAVAGSAYATLGRSAPQSRVVYLLGPAHWKEVHGVALSSAVAFATPLGEAPLALDRIAELRAATANYVVDDAAHAPEHCLEVELPFLQVVLGSFSFVPMLFDDEADLERVGDDLATLLERHPEDLVVVSSDLSHYHAYQDAVNTDAAFLKALAQDDQAKVNIGEACGLAPILSLMRIANLCGWQAHLLDYANSGDTCGPKHEVVGYGAVAYTRGAADPATALHRSPAVE